MELINPMYCLKNRRIDLTNQSKLSLTKEEVLKWIENHPKTKYDGDYEKQNFPFVTEIFFMTYYGLHIGLIRIITIYIDFMQTLHRYLYKK